MLLWSPQQLKALKRLKFVEVFCQCLRHGSLVPCPSLLFAGIALVGVFYVNTSSPSPAAPQTGPHVFFFFCDSGVTRLADISLNDPISISIADEIQKGLKPASQTDREPNSSSNCMDQENFAVPEKLKQYVMMVPSKLRLVTLAAFILEKCKVRLFAFILLRSPLFFPTPLSVTLSRIAWIKSRALKCI